MCPGSIKSDSRRLAPSIKNMIGGMNTSILPNRARKKRRVTKAIHVVSMLATIGIKTKAVPLIADCSDGMPSERRRDIFSDSVARSY